MTMVSVGKESEAKRTSPRLSSSKNWPRVCSCCRFSQPTFGKENLNAMQRS